MFEIKTDPKLPHHYLISVGLTTMHDKEPGKMYLKHGPLYFTNDDVLKVQGAAIMSQDKLFKTSPKQAVENFGCGKLAVAIRGMQLAAAANQCSMHHFSSPYKLDDEWFVRLVDGANKMEHNLNLLKNSKMR